MNHSQPPPLGVEIAATMGSASLSVAATQASYISSHPWLQDVFAVLGAFAAVFSICASTVAIFSRLISHKSRPSDENVK
jgi:hypothetical protein